ncbi:unnamed protein product [Amaranthus hypochondriacus]
MDFSPFKLDIDELIKEFAEGELQSFSDMKRLWLERKFSYIFEAQPSTSVIIFMQILYSHTISYMICTNSLSQRLGALYVLYCLFEAQPFKPPFKIYLSLGELRNLKALVVNTKQKGIKVVSVIVKRMLEKNAFLFGFVNINDYAGNERNKEVVNVQNARIKKMQEILLSNTEIEQYLHMDMGTELDLEALMKMSKEYAGIKSLAIREASQVVDVGNIEHIADERPTVGDEVQKITEEWGNQKAIFSQLTGTDQHVVASHAERREIHDEQPILLSAAQQQQSDDDRQQIAFMDLLMGDESPTVNRNPQCAPAEQQSVPEDEELDDDEYAKDLENQLNDDWEY